MPDAKITALTAISVIDPAVDPLPIVDVSDTAMAASGTTKKITINQILGASGTATLASATITGDLTVDTNTLKVVSSLDFVAIGATTQSFGEKFRINGNYTVMNDGAFTGFLGKASAIGASGSTTDFGIRSENALVFLTNGATEQMRLNSTGLGVGGVPSGLAPMILVQGGAGTYAKFNSTVGAKTWSAGYRSGTLQYEIQEDGTERFVIANGGNVGIGVTPSVGWRAGSRALQLGAARFVSLHEATNGSANLAFAAYESGANAYSYTTTGDAPSRYSLINGRHEWFTAPPGTAGTAISFTQAMTLDASGNLLVGVTTTGNRLDVQKSTDCTVLVKSTGANANVALDYVSTYGNHTIRRSGTAVWDFGVINDASATPAFKVSNASSVGVQLVSGATSWTTLSDETMKDIIEPISNAVAKVGSLRSVIGKFKTDDSGKRRSFLIAQDVQSVLPEAVDVIGENNELGLRYTEVIPLLVAAIKELTAEVNALKNA